MKAFFKQYCSGNSKTNSDTHRNFLEYFYVQFQDLAEKNTYLLFPYS